MAGSAVVREFKPRRGSVQATDQPNMLARRGGHDGRQLMEHGKPDEIMSTNTVSMEQHGSREWAKLIVKLRWIGLEDEARHLQQALSTLPLEENGIVAVGPFSTD